MSETLRYSRSQLESLGSGLGRLADDVRDNGDLRDVGLEDVAHQRVVDALQDFTDDWDDKRETLARSLEALGRLAAEAARTFGEADEKLAKEVSDILTKEGQ